MKFSLLSFFVFVLLVEIYMGQNKITPSLLKKYMNMKSIYIVDVREDAISNAGYFHNSIILPLTLSYDKFFPAIFPRDSYIVLICDKENYRTALNKTNAFNAYKVIGYVIYEDIKKDGLQIDKAEYNENTKEDVEKLVAQNEYMIDVREVVEFNETGVVKGSVLIPLTTFVQKYTIIPKHNKTIYVFCKLGRRALTVMTYLKRAGYRNKFYIMRGGLTKTISEGYKLEPYRP